MFQFTLAAIDIFFTLCILLACVVVAGLTVHIAMGVYVRLYLEAWAIFHYGERQLRLWLAVKR